jgi:hypothetical protein
MRDEFFVKHRTAQEGFYPSSLPWKYAGPFASRREADAHWAKIQPNWQEGEVVTKCEHCGQFAPVDKPEPKPRPTAWGGSHE